MALNNNMRLRGEALRSLAFGSIGATLTALGVPLANPTRIFKIDNQTDALIIGSIDAREGLDQFVLPAGSFLLIDVTTNQAPTGNLYIPEGNQVAIRYSGSAPTSGSVYLSTFYAGSR